MAAERTAEPSSARQDELRGRLRSMWSAVAPAWGDNAEFLDTRRAVLTARMLDLTEPAPGERVLELACGPGSVGLAAAQRVGADGEVVMSDVVPEMTAIAAARSEGMPNVRTRVIDLEEIGEPDAAFDIVLCRDGLMLATDPVRGAREIRRVLRPEGRAAVAVWGPRSKNPWLGLFFDVVSEQLGSPMPPPDVPHAFTLADPDRLAGVLRSGGLADVSVGEVHVPYVAESVEEWWSRTLSLTGSLAHTLATLPEQAVLALRERAREAVSPYQTSAGLELPGMALVAFARREL